MTYAIITETDFRTEFRFDIRGTDRLEKYTNSRIMAIYPKGKRIPITVGDLSIYVTVKSVIKVYEESRAEIMY